MSSLIARLPSRMGKTLKPVIWSEHWRGATHSNVVDCHAHSSVVVDLLRGDPLGLVGEKDAEKQQQPLEAIEDACGQGDKWGSDLRQL